MQIVIDIPNEEVPNKQEIKDISLHFIAGEVCECSYPYIVLPKGHGDLIDRKELLKQPMDLANCLSNYVRVAPTIIEADKEDQKMNESKVLVEAKEMEYSEAFSSSKVLYLEMSEDGYGICIINCRHDHPCGYVTFPGIDKVENYDYFYVSAMVHGGFTFLGKLNPDLWKELWAYGVNSDIYQNIKWIGWDYAHLGDYPLFDVFDEAKKWTTDEVLAEARAIMSDIWAGKYENDCECSYVEVEEDENPDITGIKEEIEKLEKFYERVSSTMSNYERIMAKTALLELKLKTI